MRLPRPLTACSQRGDDRRVVILPGLGNATGDYAALTAELQRRGYAASVARVARPDWLRNARGLLDPSYYTGRLAPLPTVNWYLDRVAAEVGGGGAGPVTLLAHSAGGWLGRVFLQARGRGAVDRLVCLGSPHNPVPEGTPGAFDQTRGILRWCEENCQQVPGVQYTTVAGKWMQGAPLRSSAPLSRRLVGLGYAVQCGDASAWGDGVVPVQTALLAGAQHLTLPGVYHSPVGAVEEEVLTAGPLPALAAEQQAPRKGRVWYGSPSALDQWQHCLG